jgi:hypothetical protein
MFLYTTSLHVIACPASDGGLGPKSYDLCHVATVNIDQPEIYKKRCVYAMLLALEVRNSPQL